MRFGFRIGFTFTLDVVNNIVHLFSAMRILTADEELASACTGLSEHADGDLTGCSTGDTTSDSASVAGGVGWLADAEVRLTASDGLFVKSRMAF